MKESFLIKLRKLATNLQHRLKSQPGNKLNLIAVTGTAGKTTTAHILYEIFNAVGVNIAAITSEGTFLGSRQINATPVDVLTSSQLFEILALLERSNASLVILETPASLIERNMVDPLTFQATIFTNLILEEPANDPQAELIFTPVLHTKEKGLVILNGDDDNIDWINSRSQSVEQKLFAAWCKHDQVQNLVLSEQGCAFSINGQAYSIPLLGQVNLSNTLLALRFALQYLKPAQIASILHRINPLPGKLELVSDNPFPIIIDEATDPLVYSRIVSSLRSIDPAQPKLVSVIGASSARDDIVGFVAALNSRIVIIAPQDAGRNDLSAINNALVSATEQHSGVIVERFNSAEEFNLQDPEKLITKIQRVIDNGDVPVIVFDEPNAEMRSAAIQFALSVANEQDYVLISGMGAKRELMLNGVYYQWSDAEVVRQALANLDTSDKSE